MAASGARAVGSTPPRSVIIAVLTFRRHEHLAELLPMLGSQVAGVNADPVGDFSAAVLVVDNDPAGSAREVAAGSGLEVRYVCEPRPGIAAARNRALAEAADFDVVVFIDDDERPSRRWLELLLATYRQFSSAAVAGPVTTECDEPLDPWIIAGGFFDRSHRATVATGDVVSMAATNNLLLDLDVVRGHRMTFAERLGLGGGEDSLFTRTLTARGERIVWCAEAGVVEHLLAARMTRRYVLTRALGHGNTAVTVRLALTEGLARYRLRAACVITGCMRILFGAVRLLVGIISQSTRHQAQGAKTLARGMGMLLGAVGHTFQEYRR